MSDSLRKAVSHRIESSSDDIHRKPAIPSRASYAADRVAASAASAAASAAAVGVDVTVAASMASKSLVLFGAGLV